MSKLYFILPILAGLSTIVDAVTECPSYCDQNNILHPQVNCTEYCCGNLNIRYCCDIKDQDISNRFPDVKVCNNSWLIYHWQLLLGSMGIMVMMIVIAACCCQCCSLKNGGWQEAARSRGAPRRPHNRSGTELSTIDIPDSTQPSFFDPTHPYAFTPPDYESLAKDPPTYSDIFGGESCNPAFEGDGEAPSTERPMAGTGVVVGGRVEPPPAYKEQEETTEAHTSGQQHRQNTHQQQQPQQQQPQQPQPPQVAARGQATRGAPQRAPEEHASPAGRSECSRPAPNLTSVHHGPDEKQPSPSRAVADVNTPETNPSTSQEAAQRSHMNSNENQTTVQIQAALDTTSNI